MRRVVAMPLQVVKIYTCLLLMFSFLGNDFLSFRWFLDIPMNPYRLLLCFAPIILLFSPSSLWKNIKSGEAKYYVCFLIILSIYAVFSGLWVKDNTRWAMNTAFLLGGSITTVLAIGCIDSKKVLIQALRVLQFCAIFVFFGAMIEVFTEHYFFINQEVALELASYKIESFMGLAQPVFSMRNINDLSSFMFFALIASVVLLSFSLKSSKQSKLLICWDVIAIASFTFFILLGESRSVLLGLTAAFFMAIFYWFYNKYKNSKPGLVKACFIIIALLILTFLVLYFYKMFTAERINQESDRTRFELIQNSWHFFKPLWYRGLGWGGIEYYNSTFHIYNKTSTVPNLHNWILEILFSCGIFIFLLYMWVYVRTTWSAAKLLLFGDNGTQNKIATLALVITMFSFVAISIASSSFISDEWFWSVWALTFAIYAFLMRKK